MNLKALITTLVLAGTSTAALAQPVVSFRGKASFQIGTRPASVRPSVRDHRTAVRPPVAQPPRAQPPVLYTQPVFGAQAHEVYDYDRHEPFEPSYTQPINLIVGGDGSSYSGAIFSVLDRPGWTPITEGTRIEKGREFINLGNAGPIRSLILQQMAGSTQISHVSIEFTDHTVRVVDLDATLTTRTGQREIPLGGRVGVHRIVVYGASSTGSAYRLLAR